MNGGLWPAKCGPGGWCPATTTSGEGLPVGPQQPQTRLQSVQAQMEISSLYPYRNPVSQNPAPNPVHGGPGPGEMRNPTLPLLSGQPNYNNALQGFVFPFTSPRPILESEINEIRNRILQSGFSKGQVNGGRVQSLDFRTPQKVPLNGKSASKIGDQILVFCMKTVGELLVIESRFLGVICVCHKLKMSVAKFCEHSNVNSSKAGESVYMENGMTISQWAKVFLQVENIRWDWPNESLDSATSQNYNNNNSLVLKNPGQVKNIFDGYSNNNIAFLSANPNLAAQRGGQIERPISVEKVVNSGNSNWNRENNDKVSSLRFEKGVSYGNRDNNNNNNTSSSSSLRFEKGPSFGNRENNTSSLSFEKGPSYGNSNWNRENNSFNPSSIFEKGTINGNNLRNNSSYSFPRVEVGIISGNRENNPSSSSRFEITPSFENNTQNKEHNKISSPSTFGNCTGNRENNNSSQFLTFSKEMNFGNSSGNRENSNSSPSLPFGKGMNFGNSKGMNFENSSGNRENNNSSPSLPFGKGMNFENSSGNRENNNSSPSLPFSKGMNFENSRGNRENNNSSPSGFELKLGQPSNNTNNNSIRNVIPNYLQSCTVFDARNPHSYQPYVNKDFSLKETEKPTQIPQKEDLQFSGNPIKPTQNPPKEDLQFPENSTTLNSNLTSDNSLISLFLSHLERKNPTEAADDTSRTINNDSFRGLDEKSSFSDNQAKNGLLTTSLASNLNFSRFYANDGGPICNFDQNMRPCSLNLENSASRQQGFQPVKNSPLLKNPENAPEQNLTMFYENAPQHGKMCCLSNLNNNKNGLKALNEDLSHGSRCKDHQSINQCVECMRERTCTNENLPCVSNKHEILTKYNTNRSNTEISQNKHAISSIEESQHTVEDSNQRPNLLNPNPNLWKDVPKKVSIPEKEISSVSSYSSAPVITETGTNEPVPVLADEASGVEKCGSSDEKNEFGTQIELSKPSNSVINSDFFKRKHVLLRNVQNRPVKRLRNNISSVKSTFSERRKKEKLVDLVHHEPVTNSDSESFSSESDTKTSDYSDSSDSSESYSQEKSKEKSVDSVHHGPPTNKASFGRKRKESSVGLVHHGPTSFTNSGNEMSCEKRKEEVDMVHHGPIQQGRKMPKYKYLSLIGVGERERVKETETETRKDSNLGFKRNKPIVSGDLGIISNGLSGDLMKSNVKIVSLISVLRRTEKDKAGDKKKEIESEKSNGLVRDKTDLKKTKGLSGNCLKNEGKELKKRRNVLFSGSEESCRKTRRVRKKSMPINIIKEKEKEMDCFESFDNTESEQVSPLSSEENQVTNCLSQRNETRYNDKGQDRHLASNSSCSVCRSSNEEEFNKIIQCNQCFIRVHQACYGVSTVPKSSWLCRPCKTNYFNPLCVLCGYKGGAMTRASKPQKLLTSLLKHIQLSGPHAPSPQGLHGPGGIRWVHVVCGLWTPGTRCLNVGTMATFDVSGASVGNKNKRNIIVCSICNRAGGSCIECRFSDCSVVFHPWCAHKKGLLQNETEEDNKVGFYGRCIFHAMLSNSDGETNKIVQKTEKENAFIEELTCARTEGFKGRKSEKKLSSNYKKVAKQEGIVSQEQINAWSRINGQNPFKNCISKPLSSDVEPDSRKEYVRYKQLKAWEKLIVYKSGIHSLGLYTSCFIPRGSMVVEYVGEIVGQRVADKREREYQSIQRLHSKSACYFFRIDKNHIIDATKKGGVARFVNHSCSPNCVAKIISVKNEKKVVFFAEREINPGEEITYDYHFNREDEGEKIPCFCNSKNCRLYLN